MLKPFLLICAVAISSLGFELKSSSPGKDSLIEDPPLKVTLTFSEAVVAESSSIEFLHRDTTAFFGISPKSTDKPETIEAIVPRKLLGGHYLLRWKTLTKSGNHQSGMYAFIVDVPE